MPKNKTDNFLKAIKKYANAQKHAMEGEVRQMKTERLKEAEAKAKRDSEKLKKEKLNESHNMKYRCPRFKNPGRSEKALPRAFEDDRGGI